MTESTFPKADSPSTSSSSSLKSLAGSLKKSRCKTISGSGPRPSGLKTKEMMPARTDAAWSKEMRKVVSELRKGADEYSQEEIDSIVDEAVKAVRTEKGARREKVGA